MKRFQSPYTCIGDSAGDLRHFDMTVRCAAHYAGATLISNVMLCDTGSSKAGDLKIIELLDESSAWVQTGSKREFGLLGYPRDYGRIPFVQHSYSDL